MSDENENDVEPTEEPGTPVSRNYPPNTDRQRRPGATVNRTARPKEDKKEKVKPKVEKVTQGEVKQHKKSLGTKIRDIFTVEDMSTVGYFIVHEIVVPAVKNMLVESVSQGVERSVFGDSGRRSSAGRADNRIRTNYGAYSQSRNSPAGRAGEADSPRSMSYRGRAAHDFDEILFETRGDADLVVDGLVDMIRQYDVATVADLYDLAGYTSKFTDNKWGWTSLAGAGVSRAGRGYVLDLPRASEIE